MRRCLLVLGSAAVFLTAGANVPSAAARDLALDVEFTGAVSVVWQGRAEPVCAATGTCGLTGSATYRPTGLLLELHSDGSSSGSGGLPLEPSIVRVRQERPSGPPATCIDVLSAFPSSSVEVFDGILEFNLAAHELSGGRCAGPRPLDLLRALPFRSLSVRSLRRRARVVDMSGRFPFVAGPFTGQVISTVRVRVRRLSGSGAGLLGTQIVEGRGVTRDRGRRLRREVLRLVYRTGPVAGTLQTSFRGRVEPACVALGACGARGTSSYEFAAKGARVDVFAWRSRRRGPARKQALLRALQQGRLPVEADTSLRTPSSRVRQAIALGGGTSCTDSMFIEPPELLVRPQRAAPRLSVYLRPSDFSSYADVVRARCPGPGQPDVLPGEVLARGSVDMRSLGLAELPVALRPTSGAFLGDGYSGERGGEVPLGLRLALSDAWIERF